jgi:uncharacterized cupredoxin-like copper-binding protein
MSRSQRAVLASLLVVTIAACGGDDEAAGARGDADRTIEVDMVDLAFEPSDIEVEAGETVRFVFTNAGDVPHDAFIGDDDAQADHAADMAGDHGGGHGDGDGITVEPGKRAQITHTFGASDDELLIGCHQPGHYEAGMVSTIHVT